MGHPKFAYVAENLLLRGGYRKTHFQADQTTLRAVSQMGRINDARVESLRFEFTSYTPRIALNRANADPPKSYPLSELIVQTLIKRYLQRRRNLNQFLSALGLDELHSQQLEILAERALPKGHVDILIKDATPIGTTTVIAVEVTLGVARPNDLVQLEQYVRIIGEECRAGVLIARSASANLVASARERDLHIFSYATDATDETVLPTFEDLLTRFSINHLEV